MRKEPFGVGDYVHVLKRGVRKLPIVRDEADKWRFLKILCHLNDEYSFEKWEEEIEKNIENSGATMFDRPINWPERKPLTRILAYTLLPNHFHLLLKEENQGGISKFMQKIGNSMTGHFNLKYEEVGSLFQGAYKARRVADDVYLRRLALYIMVKNTFELYPNGGLKGAILDFPKAYKWACDYPFSSFAVYGAEKKSQIVDTELLGKIYSSPDYFKKNALEYMRGMADASNIDMKEVFE